MTYSAINSLYNTTMLLITFLPLNSLQPEPDRIPTVEPRLLPTIKQVWNESVTHCAAKCQDDPPGHTKVQ